MIFHLIILTARNNPLATSDREVSKDTVLLIFVPGVCFQTLALEHFIVSMSLSNIEFAEQSQWDKNWYYLGVIPELQGVVQSGSQNVLP